MSELNLFTGESKKDYKYIKRLSKSKLNSFAQCPKQFQLMTDYPNESVPGPALINGIKVHDMFDKLYENTNQYHNKEDILKKLDEIEPNNFKDYKEKFAIWQEEMCFPIIENTEEKIFDKEDNIVIKYDRIDYDGDIRILWDYKTGKKKKVENFEFELLQYAYYFMKHTRKKVHYVGIYFADHGVSDLMEITDEKIQQMLVQLHNYISDIKDMEMQGSFPAKLGFQCKFCQWNHLCSQYQNKKW